MQLRGRWSGTLMMAAELIMALQTIVSREINPIEPAVETSLKTGIVMMATAALELFEGK
ncbi:peptidase, M20 family [delta proteobacterium NaphS2]|nr:peptidase, M20 family [delta proteobacterium NaphS2]